MVWFNMAMTVEVFSSRKNVFFYPFSMWLLQKQPPEVFCKKGVLNNFTIFTGKLLCWRLEHTCFPVNIAKFLRTLILKNICEQLLLLPKPWLYCFLALYLFKLTKHSDFLFFTASHANLATLKLKNMVKFPIILTSL